LVFDINALEAWHKSNRSLVWRSTQGRRFMLFVVEVGLKLQLVW
jgi:hypothetical protein